MYRRSRFVPRSARRRSRPGRSLSSRDVELPPSFERALRWLTLGLTGVFAVATIFAASVMPYRFWDSLAFGSWSRSIADSGDLWANTSALSVSRPLFYVPQGVAWRFLTEGEWLGRVWSATFGAALVAAVWILARQLTKDRTANALMPPLAVGVLLSYGAFATYVAAGMTDVPVAAATAATAVALWSSRSARTMLPLAALGAAATVLAKPSGLLALAGLLLATAALRGRRSVVGIGGVGIGVAVALGYDTWQAARFDVSLSTLLRAGNDDFWLARGNAARWDALANADWVGDGARLIVVFALVHALARVVGARSRVALGVAAAVAVLWSIAGPLVADGELGYPLDGHVVGLVGWLALVGALLVAPFVAVDDKVPRRAYGALLLWVGPIGIIWITQRADEARLLAPAWPALALLAAAALTSVSLALFRLRPAAALVPAGAVAVVALANVVSVDGLGRDGWRGLLDLGRSGWTDRAAMENYAYGPFSYELDLARENVMQGDVIVSSDGRLSYFFPGQVDVRYARTCGELAGARFFSFLSAGESLELAQLGSQPTEPLGWIQCESPRVELIGEQSGIYAAYVVGGPPARASTAEDCRIVSTSGELVDALFGDGLTYRQATALLERALASGFVGTKIERTNCETFRVVVTGVPDDAAVQADFRRQAESVGLSVAYADAQRFPEVSPDVQPVSR